MSNADEMLIVCSGPVIENELKHLNEDLQDLGTISKSYGQRDRFSMLQILKYASLDKSTFEDLSALIKCEVHGSHGQYATAPIFGFLKQCSIVSRARL